MILEQRKVDIAYSPTVDRHWLNGNAFETHFLNAYTMLIPDGERFIIRSSKRYMDRLPDDLKRETQALFYQEAQHSAQHAKTLAVLEGQGYRVRGFIALTQFLAYRVAERIAPRALRLSTCAGIEHINACIAEFFLKDEPLFEGAEKGMAQIFAWHFAEEMEHGCVVFDILRHIKASYLMRIAGLVVSFSMFVPMLYLGAIYLASQDRSLYHFPFWRDMWRFNFKRGFVPVLVSALGQYLRRSFHPQDMLDAGLIRKGIDHYERLANSTTP